MPNPRREPTVASQFPELLESQRRAMRVGVELPVRGKAGLIRSTFLLKDLTRFGARICGLGIQRVGEPITLLLPGSTRATTAFVMWANPQAAGLEFLEPLDEALFARLVEDYAMGRMTDAAPVPPPLAAPQTGTAAIEPPRFAA